MAWDLVHEISEIRSTLEQMCILLSDLHVCTAMENNVFLIFNASTT